MSGKTSRPWEFPLILILCFVLISALKACKSEPAAGEITLTDDDTIVSDSLLAYDPNTYEEIVIIYSMPARMIEKDKRGSIRDHMFRNADKLSIDTTIVFDPEEFRLKRWEITAVPAVE